MRATLAVGVVAVGLALIVSEAAMRPSSDERLALYGLFGAAVVVAGLVCWWLTRVHRRLPSLRWTMLLVATSAVIIAGAVVAASAAAMVLAPPGVRVVVAALAMGTGLGLLAAIGVTGPLTTDLRQLAATARRVADSDREVRTRMAATRSAPWRTRSTAWSTSWHGLVAGDLRALDRVLRNLLDNAVRHAPPCTAVQVAVETEGSSATIRVRDEGPGFPPEFGSSRPTRRRSCSASRSPPGPLGRRRRVRRWTGATGP